MEKTGRGALLERGLFGVRRDGVPKSENCWISKLAGEACVPSMTLWSYKSTSVVVFNKKNNAAGCRGQGSNAFHQGWSR